VNIAKEVTVKRSVRISLVGLLASAIAVPAAISLATSSDAATTKVTNTLQSMAAEEKLAHDVYVTLGERYNLRILENISNAESTHLEALRILMDRYGVVDPTAGDAVGEFDDADIQSLYDRLVSRGEQSVIDAMKVGVRIEKLDIADLNEQLAKSLPSDISNVLRNLRSGSQRHLTAFSRFS